MRPSSMACDSVQSSVPLGYIVIVVSRCKDPPVVPGGTCSSYDWVLYVPLQPVVETAAPANAGNAATPTNVSPTISAVWWSRDARMPRPSVERAHRALIARMISPFVVETSAAQPLRGAF